MRSYIFFVGILLSNAISSMDKWSWAIDGNFGRHTLLPKDPEIVRDTSTADLQKSYSESAQALRHALDFTQKNLIQSLSELSVLERNNALERLTKIAFDSINENDITLLQSLISSIKKFNNAKCLVENIEIKLLIARLHYNQLDAIAIQRSDKDLEEKYAAYRQINDESTWEVVQKALAAYLSEARKHPLIPTPVLTLEEALDDYLRNPSEEIWQSVRILLAPFKAHSQTTIEIKYALQISILKADLRAFTDLFEKADILEIRFHRGDDCLQKAIESYNRAWLCGSVTTDHLKIVEMLLAYYMHHYNQADDYTGAKAFAAKILTLFSTATKGGDIGCYNLLYPYVAESDQYKKMSKIDIAFDSYSKNGNVKIRMLLIAQIKESLGEPELANSIIEWAIFRADEELLSELIKVIDMQSILFEGNRNALDIALDVYLTNETKYAAIVTLLLLKCKLKHMLNSQGSSPQARINAMLFNAIETQNTRMCNMLYAHADLTANDVHGNTLMHKILFNYVRNKDSMLPILRLFERDRSHVDMNIANKEGKTIRSEATAAFFEAADRCDIESFQIFHSFIQDITISDRDGNTCLHKAVRKLQEEPNGSRRLDFLKLIRFIVNTKKEALDISNHQQLSPRQMLAQCDIQL